MRETELREIWKKEEKIAHIKGWDFSHIDGKYDEEKDLPWDYKSIVNQYLKDNMELLDYDTGGGEFLLSLNHPFEKTSATEGFQPNVELCREKLLPLGINFRECCNPADIPYNSETFDMIINRHGAFDARELYRLFSHLRLKEQIKVFEEAGFQIVRAEEAYRPIKFYDIGAFVWFARIIEWEFLDFSVDRCFQRLLKMQEILEEKGEIEGTIHRYLIVVRK